MPAFQINFTLGNISSNLKMLNQMKYHLMEMFMVFQSIIDAINKSDILNILKYLMVKNNILNLCIVLFLLDY